MTRTTALCILIFLLPFTAASGQSRANADQDPERKVDSSLIPAVEYPWAGRVFLAAGYGYPQGFRSELGYNFGGYFFAGFTFGIYDGWSSDPGEGTFGIVAGLHFPTSGSSGITPYMLFCTGTTFSIFGGADSYNLINAGAMIPLVGRLTLRPELSMGFTSKHLYGGRGVFGSSPESRETRMRVGLNVLFEVAL